MNDRYDVVVVGAGIHGAGVAQAAAAAGYDVLVLEQTAIAAGTSSRSSKLIHGGLRYLEHGQFRLVRESLRERDLLLRLAPTLVWPLTFHLPVYAASTRGALEIRAGLSLYALLGGLGLHARFDTLPRPAWESLDGLCTRGLKAVFRYVDAQTDDAALTRAVTRSALQLGAVLACPAYFCGARQTAECIDIEYRSASRTERCQAQVLVNAAGPWTQRVLHAVQPLPPSPAVELVQGAHIVVAGRVARGAYYLEARDRRPVFVLPHGDNTLIGTTETTFTGDPAQVQAQAAEIAYLQETLGQYFPLQATAPLTHYAGVRVLPTAPTRYGSRPRDTQLYLSGRTLSIYGGKLTGYRATAERVMQRLRPLLPSRKRRAHTAELPLE